MRVLMNVRQWQDRNCIFEKKKKNTEKSSKYMKYEIDCSSTL